eukprot:Sspe_Gene.79366::Locus_49758_Transcript_2_3_Confidence_0.500_Length_1982::g.79366::m.79366/K20782/HPAT; hydroxyproline O-arabinosyltransferase
MARGKWWVVLLGVVLTLATLPLLGQLRNAAVPSSRMEYVSYLTTPLANTRKASPRESVLVHIPSSSILFRIKLPGNATPASLMTLLQAHPRLHSDRITIKALQVRDLLRGTTTLLSDHDSLPNLSPARHVIDVIPAAPTTPAPTSAGQPQKGITDQCGVSMPSSGLWEVVSTSHSCEGNPEGIERSSAKWDLSDRQACLAACDEDPLCVAVDWYCQTRWCNLYHEVCKTPTSTHAGASVYKNKGRLAKMKNHDECPEQPKPYHVMVTASSALYEQWIARLMFYWYKKVKAKDSCGEMGGFTRLLHSPADELMDEIPTVVVNRLEDDLGFVVLNRPNAMKQWLAMLDAGKVSIKEEYVLLMEPDQLFVKPLPNMAPLGYHFAYMHAAKDSALEAAVLPHLPANVSAQKLSPSGPSPTLLSLNDWRRVTPAWLSRSIELQKDPKARKELNWVLEMWGFVIAAAEVGIDIDAMNQMQIDPCTVKYCSEHMSSNEGAWLVRRSKGPFMVHITFALSFDLDGRWWDLSVNGSTAPWCWNKRNYYTAYPPRALTPPPPGANHTPAHLVVEMINEATKAIPTWGAGHSFGRDTCTAECPGFASRGVLPRLIA